MGDISSVAQRSFSWPQRPIATYFHLLAPAPRPASATAEPPLPPADAPENILYVDRFIWTSHNVATPGPIAQPLPERISQAIEPALPYALSLYFAGLAILTLRLLAGALRLKRLSRTGCAAPHAVVEILEKLRRQLRITRAVRLLETARVEVPTLAGWITPVIFLPATALTGLSPDQLAALFAHELAHIRRHDYLVNLLQSFIEMLLFYHPAVWWLSAHIRQEREHCCDDMAIATTANRAAYARALQTMESLRTRPQWVPESLAVGARTGALLPRIQRILGLKNTPRSRPLMATSTAVTLALLLASAAIYFGCNHNTGAPATSPAAATDTAPSAAPNQNITFRARILLIPDDALAHLPVPWNSSANVHAEVVDVGGDQRRVRPATESTGTQPASNPASTSPAGPSPSAILDGGISQNILAQAKKDPNTTVLSSPTITAVNGQPAELVTSQQQNYVKSFQNTPATQPGAKPGLQLNVATLTTGLTISLQGSLTDDQKAAQTSLQFKNVTLDGIDTFTLAGPPSAAAAIQNPPAGQLPQEPFVQVPKTTEVSVIAMAKIPLGQTLWIRGPRLTDEHEHTSAVPGLSAIPKVGEMFKQRTYAKTSTNLVILLTPTLGETDSTAAVTPEEPAATGAAIPTTLGTVDTPVLEPAAAQNPANPEDRHAVVMDIQLVGVSAAFLDDFRFGQGVTYPWGIQKTPPPAGAGVPNASIIDDWTRNLFQTATLADKRTRNLAAARIISFNRQAVDVPIHFPLPVPATEAPATQPAEKSLTLRYLATTSADKKWVVLQLGPDAPPEPAGNFATPPHIPVHEINPMMSIPVGGSLLVNLGKAEPSASSETAEESGPVFLLLRPTIANTAPPTSAPATPK